MLSYAKCRARSSDIEQPGDFKLKRCVLVRGNLLEHVPFPAMLTLGDVLAGVPVDGPDRGLLSAVFIQASEFLHRTPPKALLFDIKLRFVRLERGHGDSSIRITEFGR